MSDEIDTTPLIDGETLPEGHRSGFVAVIGKPNVGKSTLVNALLGEKLAIVSPKPQTTRDNQLGILTLPTAQVVFIDTPGIHIARSRLGEHMVRVAQGALRDADVVLFVVDISEPPTRADEAIAGAVREQVEGVPILILNKRDLVGIDERAAAAEPYQALLNDYEARMISATDGDAVSEVLGTIIEHLPEGPRYFPVDQLTDTWMRDSVAEVIRENILLQFEQEIPHSIHVEVEEFKERSEEMTYVRAVIYVERDSQKSIVIGKKGAALKALGKAARTDIEGVVGTSVYLDLWVKVLKNWRSDENKLRRLGYTTQD